MNPQYTPFFGHQSESVANAAIALDKLTAMRNQGLITDTEFEELGRDALRVENIKDLALDASQRQKIVEVFEHLAKLAGILLK